MFGVQKLTEDYAKSLDDEKKNASMKILEMLEKSTFALPDESKVESNLKGRFSELIYK